MHSLDGQRHAVQVGHVRPLGFYGKDNLQNVLPMSSVANWGWDEGLISSHNKGKVLLASGLTESTRQLFGKCEQITLPKDLRYWPLGENFEFHRDVIFQRSRQEREKVRIALARLRGDGTLRRED
jgi:predicted restriction endonuclease